MRVQLHNGYTQVYAQIIQHTHMYKAVTGRVEAKRFLSHQRQSNYNYFMAYVSGAVGIPDVLQCLWVNMGPVVGKKIVVLRLVLTGSCVWRIYQEKRQLFWLVSLELHFQ